MALRSLVRHTAAWLASASLGAGLVGLAARAEVDAEGFVRIRPEQVTWPGGTGDRPQQVVLEGDPDQPGLYVLRIRFPAGAFSRPHTHDQDRHVVVLEGTWYTGTGETFDPDAAVPLPAGSYMKHPAGAVHWDGAKDGDVVLQITGMGPVRTRPANAPRGEAEQVPRSR